MLRFRLSISSSSSSSMMRDVSTPREMQQRLTNDIRALQRFTFNKAAHIGGTCTARELGP